MGVEIVFILVIEKFKGKFFIVVLLSVWFIKLCFNCRWLWNLRVFDENSEFVIFDNVLFFFKSVENCYWIVLVFEVCSFSFFDGLYFRSFSDFFIFSLCVERDGVKFVFVFLILNRKSIVCFEGILSMKSIVCFEEILIRKSMFCLEGFVGIIRLIIVIFVVIIMFFINFSIFFRCMYRFILFLGLRSLCKLVDDDDFFLKGSNLI